MPRNTSALKRLRHVSLHVQNGHVILVFYDDGPEYV